MLSIRKQSMMLSYLLSLAFGVGSSIEGIAAGVFNTTLVVCGTAAACRIVVGLPAEVERTE